MLLLSYRHSYHAGNFADVLKHIVLVEMLEHFIKKDKPFDYIDTHSGAGIYDLLSGHADKNKEYKNGIDKLKDTRWPELASYFSAIDANNKSVGLRYYPGSPAIAMEYLRRGDRAWLFEMHSADGTRLEQLFAKNRSVRVSGDDGLKGLLSLVPPVSKRGLVLIDPSYEIKQDYDQVFKAVAQAHKKFTTGTYAIWYPVVDRVRIEKLEGKFKRSGIKNIQLFELGLLEDTEERGMTSSGMMVINPPWTLKDKMSQLLPKLVKALDESGSSFYRCETLVGE